MKNLGVAFLMIACIANGINCQSSPKKDKNTFEFNNLGFSSSACNGTCPEITMQLTGFREIQLIRTIYEKKGQPDTIRSGGFKGVLNEPDYNKIVALLSKINWDTLKFPDVQCCDGPVITIYISYNRESKNFKSMMPPEATKELIRYLTDFLVTVSLPRYNKPMDFEVADPPPDVPGQ